jgi:hypothetical protein
VVKAFNRDHGVSKSDLIAARPTGRAPG